MAILGENLSPELKEYGKWLLSEAYSQTNLVFAAKVKEITDPLFAKIDELSAQVVTFASLLDEKGTVKQSTIEQAIYEEQARQRLRLGYCHERAQNVHTHRRCLLCAHGALRSYSGKRGNSYEGGEAKECRDCRTV